MSEKETWIPFSWHCEKCGHVVTGYQNKEGVIKVQCKTCRTVMVRTYKGKHSDTIQIFPPEK